MDEIQQQRPSLRQNSSRRGGRLLSRMVSSLKEESAKFRILSEETSRLFLKQNRVVGRLKQLDILDDVYERIAKSQSEAVIMIHGPSGVGKSTLLEAFVRQLPSSAFCVNGKFDQLQSHAPYAALASASDQLCRQASR